jgi:hypothetical protein
MKIKRIALVLFFGAVGISCPLKHSQAQLIGNRTVGAASGGIQQTTPGGLLGNSPSSFRTPTGAGTGFPPTGGTGAPQQNPSANQNPGGTNNPGGLARRESRFIRGNRQRGDFVGANRTDLRGFVGATQAVGVGNGSIATNNIQIETGSPRINRPLPPLSKSGMYYPKLDLNSIAQGEVEVLVSPTQVIEIQERIRQRSNPGVSVVFEGGYAVLRGEVSSNREAELIETMLGFEPGVDRVRNELVVRGK